MEAVGRIHLLNVNGGLSAEELEKKEWMAEEGKALLSSGRGIATDYGLVFKNETVPFQEIYDGGVFPEDENSETGFRKMTMKEELNGLDRAFQKMADRADIKEMIEGEFKRLRSERGNSLSPDISKKPQESVEDVTETAGQKMKRLVQEWRDAYRASGTKEGGMEKVLSLK